MRGSRMSMMAALFTAMLAPVGAMANEFGGLVGNIVSAPPMANPSVGRRRSKGGRAWQKPSNTMKFRRAAKKRRIAARANPRGAR